MIQFTSVLQGFTSHGGIGMVRFLQKFPPFQFTNSNDYSSLTDPLLDSIPT